MAKKEEKSNNMGIASMVLGIVSIIFCWIPILGLVAGIVAIVLYVKQKKIYSNAMNTTGLITGIIGLVFSIIYNLVWLVTVVLLAGTASAIAGSLV